MDIMKLFRRFKKNHPSLRDYLYVDETRLNSYLGQISSTGAFKRAPSLKSLKVGPVSVELTPHSREKTDHEKVCELVKHLESNGHISHSRPYVAHESGDYAKIPNFVLEECEAYRILIPSTKIVHGNEGIVIWISEWPLERNSHPVIQPGLLCMIQDSTYDDNKHTAGFSHSGYTWLQSLLYQLAEEDIKTRLSSQYPVSHLGDYIYDIMSVQSYLHDEEHIFRPRPLEWLKQKGCILSTNRRIVALYKIRNLGGDEIGIENNREDLTVSTFGYAIAIWGAERNSVADGRGKLAARNQRL